MRVLRPVLMGLGLGAAVAFLAALLGPRRRRPPLEPDLDDPARGPDVDLRDPLTARPAAGAP